MDTVALARRGEAAAARYMGEHGMTVVDTNWRCRMGEIDIVALDGETLVICEVKTRSTVKLGMPEDAVTPAKRARLVRLAEAYVAWAHIAPIDLRFDVVTVIVTGTQRARIRHYRDAFGRE